MRGWNSSPLQRKLTQDWITGSFFNSQWATFVRKKNNKNNKIKLNYYPTYIYIYIYIDILIIHIYKFLLNTRVTIQLSKSRHCLVAFIHFLSQCFSSQFSGEVKNYVIFISNLIDYLSGLGIVNNVLIAFFLAPFISFRALFRFFSKYFP